MTEKITTPREQIIEIPLEELKVEDVSDKHIEKMARGYIMGSQAIGRRKEVRELLEEKVIKKIGHKGKYLTDKLFELIEGVYIVDKKGGKNGRDVRYYQVPPSLNAIIYALNRVLGTPVQQSAHIEEKKGILLVEHIIRNLAGEKNEGGRIRKNIGGAGSGGDAVGDVNVRAGEEPLPE